MNELGKSSLSSRFWYLKHSLDKKRGTSGIPNKKIGDFFNEYEFVFLKVNSLKKNKKKKKGN